MLFQSVKNELIIHIGILVDSSATIGVLVAVHIGAITGRTNCKYSVDSAGFVFDEAKIPAIIQ